MMLLSYKVVKTRRDMVSIPHTSHDHDSRPTCNIFLRLERPEDGLLSVWLDRSLFDAGAEQSLDSQYGYAQMTATTNAYYPHATQAGHTNYTQTTQSSYHTHTTGHSSSCGYPNNVYSTNFQPDQLASASYQSAPTLGMPSSGSCGHSTQPSTNYSSSSSHQHAAPTVSSSSSRSAPKAKSSSSKKRASAASNSHRRPSEDTMKMREMTGRFRPPISNVPAEASSSYSAAGDKRKDRASPVLGASNTVTPLTAKKTRTVDVEEDKARETSKAKAAEKVQDWRNKRASDLADLTERLPEDMRKYTSADKPSPQNIGRAVIHIDNLVNEVAQLRAERFQLMSEHAAALAEKEVLENDLHWKNVKIGELEQELQTWRYVHP